MNCTLPRDNHCGIPLIGIASKQYVDAFLWKPSSSIPQNQTGFRSDWVSLDYLSVRRILGCRQALYRLTIFVPFDLRVVSDSTDCEVLWSCLSVQNVPPEFTCFQFLYLNSRNSVRAHDDLSSRLMIQISARLGCPLSQVVIKMNIHIVQSSVWSSSIEIWPNENLSDLDYPDDFVLLCKNPGRIINTSRPSK